MRLPDRRWGASRHRIDKRFAFLGSPTASAMLDRLSVLLAVNVSFDDLIAIFVLTVVGFENTQCRSERTLGFPSPESLSPHQRTL